MVLKECPQTKCAFHKSHGMDASLMCPICSECSSPSNIYEDTNCVECWGCIKDEGKIRSGHPDFTKIAEKQKPLEEKQEEMVIER